MVDIKFQPADIVIINESREDYTNLPCTCGSKNCEGVRETYCTVKTLQAFIIKEVKLPPLMKERSYICIEGMDEYGKEWTRVIRQSEIVAFIKITDEE